MNDTTIALDWRAVLALAAVLLLVIGALVLVAWRRTRQVAAETVKRRKAERALHNERAERVLRDMTSEEAALRLQQLTDDEPEDDGGSLPN